MESSPKLIVFQDKNIRRTWHNEEWYFSVTDIVFVLTDSVDEMAYWRQLKSREPQLVTICHALKLTAKDGKLRLTDCVTTKNAFRLIQSIPSPKAEPFKQWLAKVGYERIQEIENPELATNRIKSYYEQKGYSQSWIEKRLRGIAIRQDLENEWKQRGIKEGLDFAILTNEISKATFDVTVQEHKEFKELTKPNQNLRDHMSDWELILTMIGEKATTDITDANNAQGLPECKVAANQGGKIAKSTKDAVEKATGKSLLSRKNYLHLTQNDKSMLKEDSTEYGESY